MNLYDATKDLHHDAEKHPFGARMAAGEISKQEWADWLGAMQAIHLAIDPHLPPALQRGGALLLDLTRTLPVMPRVCWSARRFSGALDGPISIGGAAYILSGAHLRGGAVIRKRLEPLGMSCAHLRFDQAREGNEWICALRDAPEVAPGARAAFGAIIEVMDEIQARA